jgi:hypothetical protein
MSDENADAGPSAPNLRTFSLNSDEAYAAMCEPRERPWIPNGSLARNSRPSDRPVIVEHSRWMP